MKSYLKLLNFEMNRLAKFLFILIIVVFGIQIAGTVVISLGFTSEINDLMIRQGLTEEEVLNVFGKMTFQQIVISVFFFGTIFIAATSVLFYIFLIWYRDWVGKNTFAYRLLMLPTNRINVYLAKLSTILIMTLTFVALQIIFLKFEIQLFEWIVPEAFREDLTVSQALRQSIEMGLLYPYTFFEFLINYGTGITLVAVIFTFILFERSYRVKGIFIGIGYGVLSILVLFSPFYINDLLLNNYFYTDELILMFIMADIIVLGSAIFLGHYLLKNKIRI